MAATEIFVGIDVSKDHLDLGVSSWDEVVRLPNSDQGIAELVAQLRLFSAYSCLSDHMPRLFCSLPQ